jgi:hypothetical protein
VSAGKRLGQADLGEHGSATRRVRKIFSHLRIDLVFLISILFSMTVKPTFDDGWTVAIAGVLIVALAAFFWRQAHSVALAGEPVAESS